MCCYIRQHILARFDFSIELVRCIERKCVYPRLFFAAALMMALCGGASPVATLAAPQAQTQQLAPQIASYRMAVQLDPATKTIAGTERIAYRNPSQDALPELWLRLYLRAFRDLNTLWMKESGGQNRGFAIQPNELGDITISKLALADGSDLLASATLTDTLMRVQLPQPLAPGQVAQLDVAWSSKLPRVFARTGYGGRDDSFFMVGQWYPKMAVYDRGQWDTEPWHANSEFFNDFGSYDVSITVPQNYVVAGAGVPAGEQNAAAGAKTLRFTSDNVTDFAFAASPDFKTRNTKAGPVDVDLFYVPEHESSVDEYLKAAVGSLQAFSSWYGAYPHPRLTVVDVPDDAQGAGGMEYPSLVTGGTVGAPGGSGAVALVTSHEIGHQWWPMQTATNEGREPWLDEGLTEYSGIRYMVDSKTELGVGSFGVSAAVLDQLGYANSPRQVATLPAWQYSGGEYGIVYSKTTMGLWTLERVVGTERFRAAMAAYLAEYRFKHPTAADFRASIERSLGEQRWFFDDFMNSTGLIDYAAQPIANPASGGTVGVVRRGAVRAPVEVRITLASGAQQIKAWDGQAEQIKFDFPAGDPVTRVEIDPERKLIAEIDVTNNSVSASPEVGPALTLGGRLVFWLQMIAQSIGLFG
jgi:hypothetical protein